VRRRKREDVNILRRRSCLEQHLRLAEGKICYLQAPAVTRFVTVGDRPDFRIGGQSLGERALPGAAGRSAISFCNSMARGPHHCRYGVGRQICFRARWVARRSGHGSKTAIGSVRRGPQLPKRAQQAPRRTAQLQPADADRRAKAPCCKLRAAPPCSRHRREQCSRAWIGMPTSPTMAGPVSIRYACGRARLRQGRGGESSSLHA